MMKRGIKFTMIVLGIIVCNTLTAQKLWHPLYITPRSSGGTQHISLNGEWELSFLDQPVSSLNELSGKKEAFQTTIPNSVHWSLFKAGKLPHPYYNKHSDLYKWTDEKVWYYQKQFMAPATINDSYVFLCFDGVDYFSKVWVNDSLVGEHEGMFGGPSIEIGRLIKPGVTNSIIVELRAGNWGNKAIDFDKLPRNATGDRDFSKRTGYNPRASGRIIKPWVISGGSGGEMFFSLGMWQGVRLEIVPKVHIERPFISTRAVSATQATLHLSAEVLANTHSLELQLHPWNNTQLRHPDERGYAFKKLNSKIALQVDVTGRAKTVFSKVYPVTVYEGRNWIEEDIILNNPELWYPNGLGKSFLYQVKISLTVDGVVKDKHEFKYGVRRIDRVESAGPRTTDNFENWQFVINGKKIFVKGMNFTPQDVLLETNAERYRWTLEAARAMGVQLIRVWGGGLLETDTFYEICDELGLMVWQDFPIGNQDTPGYPQDIWEAQVVQNICRLRNHASLAVWCGGNEFNAYSYGNAASIGILERNLKTFDGTRLFVRTTPDGGSIHVYPDMDPTWYDRSYGKEAWVSETGMHSMPEANVFYETVDPREFFDLGKMWDKSFAAAHPQFIHHFTEYGPGRVPRMLSRASHIDDMSNPSIESISEATQVGAGEFYQVMSEKVQGNYPVTTGLMPWVFKRHWPVIAIQMMDWFGHAGAPYYFLKRTYEPIHVGVDLPRMMWAPGETIAVTAGLLNMAPANETTFKLTTEIFDDGFKKIWSAEKSCRVGKAAAAQKISMGNFRIPADYIDRYIFMLVSLRDATGNLVSRSYYYPRSLSVMQNPDFYKKYTTEPIAWTTFDKGPWLKPTVAKTAASLRLQLISHKKTSEDKSSITVKIKNSGAIPAFMTKLDITGVKRAFYASDNYFWLQPGEEKNITLQVLWREKRKTAQIEAAAWNAEKAVITF